MEIDEPGRRSRAPSMEERIDAAAHALMTDPQFEPLRAWWEREAFRAVTGQGPVDVNRLIMAQGDRERLLAIGIRADRHRAKLGGG